MLMLAVPMVYTKFIKAEEFLDTGERGDRAWDGMMPSTNSADEMRLLY